ncbi:MAG: degS 1 [Flavipsychrobacter sp.]|jgi:signal transduction histidine kinase|nr:degS 1 [Flavipsychrobacter sp.]
MINYSFFVYLNHLMFHRIFILLLIGCTISAHAQTERDELSLWFSKLQKHDNDNSDSIEYYYKKTAELAVKLKDIKKEIESKRIYGMHLFVNGQPDAATTLLLDALRKAEKYPPSAELAILYYGIAQVYSKNDINNIHEQYLKKGIGVALSINSNSAIGDGYNRIGIYYERKGMLDSAQYYYEHALRINEKDSTLRLGAAYSMDNLAGIYGLKNDAHTALVYFKKALPIKKAVGKPLDQAMTLINIGETFNSLKQYDSAIHYALLAQSIAHSIKYADLETYTYQFLSGIYETRKDFPKALALYKRYTILHDSILTERKAKMAIEADKKYETEKKEQHIRDLSQRATIQNLKIKQRSILLYFIIGLFIVAAIAGYLFYNRRKLKAEAKLQAEINRQQAITTREVLNAEEKERKRIAADLHDGVGQLLSASLLNLNGFFAKNSIDKTTNPDAERVLRLVTNSYDELRAISHQMMPKALAKSGLESAVQELVSGIEPDRMTVTFECSGLGSRLDEEIESVLYRVIQESINNVIKHAEAKHVDIQIHKDEDGISVTIEDDGKGFDPKTLKKAGIGLKNIYSRVQLQNGTVDIDSQPGKGTLVAIHMPA